MGMSLVKVQGASFNSIETSALGRYCNAKPGCDYAHGQVPWRLGITRKIRPIGGIVIKYFRGRLIPVSYTHLTLPTNREV